jgi:cell division protein FtsX
VCRARPITIPGATRIQRRGNRWLFLKGRLAGGRSVAEAQAQVDRVFARLRDDFPGTNEKTQGTVMPAAGIRFHPMLDGYVKAASAVLLAAVGLVLMIACANVANMLLASGASRTRELAVRAAIGASRGRLVRQLLSESLVLAAVGGGLGVLVAVWATRLLAGIPVDALPVPVQFDLHVDRTVLAFAALASVATTALSGLVPALAASRPALVPSLKADATGEGSVRRRVTLRDGLVVAQLAMSLVLLVAGALLTRGLLAARGTDLGYDPTPVSSLQFNLQMNGYDEARALAFRQRVIAELQALPGVSAVALASRLPLAPDINMEGVRIQGRHQPQDEPTPIDSVGVGPDYFRAVGVPILEGRSFTEDETSREDGPDRQPGLRPPLLAGTDGARPARLHVGLRQGAPRDRGRRARPQGALGRRRVETLPALPGGSVVSDRACRAHGPALAGGPARAARGSAEVEPEVVFTDDVPRPRSRPSPAPTRIGAALLGAFGSLALLLAAVGLYGVVSYSVTLRTREMGVRMALGAQQADVLRLVFRQGARLALVGVGVGALLAALVGRVFSALLYGVSSLDPLAYAVAATVLLAVAAAANLVPALTAARVDPMRALRSE